jgi:hypothetical protein
LTRTLTCWCTVLLLAANTARATGDAGADARFAEAQTLFDTAMKTLQEQDERALDARKTFHQAASRFAAIAESGVRSANLCVNAGNAYHFAGDDPRALLWYLRANRLANTPETRTGAAALRRACGADLWPHEAGSIGRALMFWHYDLSRTTKQWILLATYPVGWVMLTASLLVRRRRLWVRVGLVLAVVGAAMGVSDLVTLGAPGAPPAVVLETTKGYAGDGARYSTTLERITPGQEVNILETRGGWLHVALPGGVTCWVPADTCETV